MIAGRRRALSMLCVFLFIDLPFIYLFTCLFSFLFLFLSFNGQSIYL